jgi:hypothetical protein
MEELLPSSRAANAPSPEKFLGPAAPSLDRYRQAKLVSVDPGQIARRIVRNGVSSRGTVRKSFGCWAFGSTLA